MYIVMTRVTLMPGAQDRCAALFKETNPGLVANEPDWLGAHMMFDPETNVVTVLATWRKLESYQRLSTSPEFGQTMKQFGAFFASSPNVSINEVLIEMEPSGG